MPTGVIEALIDSVRITSVSNLEELVMHDEYLLMMLSARWGDGQGPALTSVRHPLGSLRTRSLPARQQLSRAPQHRLSQRLPGALLLICPRKSPRRPVAQHSLPQQIVAT